MLNVAALILLLAAPALALDPACTTTTNLGMARCPDNSEDWYESYTDQIDELDTLAKTARLSSFTVTGSILVRSSGSITGALGLGTTSPCTTCQLEVVGNYSSTGSITAQNIIARGKFYGDGSSLAGVSKTQKLEYLTASGNFTVAAGVTKLSLMVCAGGGGGGGCEDDNGTSTNGGGGGGGGECVFRSSYTVTPGEVIPYVIGAGGAGGLCCIGTVSNGSNGSATTFNVGSRVVEAWTGGGGARSTGSQAVAIAFSSATGGGGARGGLYAVAVGTNGPTHYGGNGGSGNADGGGGGGAGGNGGSAGPTECVSGAGGVGVMDPLTGKWYGGGGGGGQEDFDSFCDDAGRSTGTGGQGGLGGGGNGGRYTVNATSGTANTGGGGGGCSSANSNTKDGKAGGSGVIRVAWEE